MKETFEHDVCEWRTVFEQYAPRLGPNKKSATEVLDYFKSKYPLTELRARAGARCRGQQHAAQRADSFSGP